MWFSTARALLGGRGASASERLETTLIQWFRDGCWATSSTTERQRGVTRPPRTPHRASGTKWSAAHPGHPDTPFSVVEERAPASVSKPRVARRHGARPSDVVHHGARPPRWLRSERQ